MTLCFTYPNDDDDPQKGLPVIIIVVVVASSPHQSPRCGVRRVEKDWKFWLPTMSVGNPATKRQLPFGSSSSATYVKHSVTPCLIKCSVMYIYI